MVDVDLEHIAVLAKELPRVLSTEGAPSPLREARTALEILGVALPPPETELEVTWRGGGG